MDPSRQTRFVVGLNLLLSSPSLPHLIHWLSINFFFPVTDSLSKTDSLPDHMR